VRRELRKERGVDEGDEDFQIRTAEDIIRSFRNQLSIIRAVLLGIGSISLLVGGIGIMNTMYTSVTERTREIGIMKAVGATKRQILALFMIEFGMVGMIGGILGATVGIGLSYLAAVFIRRSVSLPFQPYVSIELILGAVLFSFIVGMVSGALPARKASNKEPAEALMYG
jgi:putative ABC transport system permease protein